MSLGTIDEEQMALRQINSKLCYDKNICGKSWQLASVWQFIVAA